MALIVRREALCALGEHRPHIGRIEALNNNWAVLVRRARGYRDHPYLLLKLKFMTTNPVRTVEGAHPRGRRVAGPAFDEVPVYLVLLPPPSCRLRANAVDARWKRQTVGN